MVFKLLKQIDSGVPIVFKGDITRKKVIVGYRHSICPGVITHHKFNFSVVAHRKAVDKVFCVASGARGENCNLNFFGHVGANICNFHLSFQVYFWFLKQFQSGGVLKYDLPSTFEPIFFNVETERNTSPDSHRNEFV
jgi:hypothetical protein